MPVPMRSAFQKAEAKYNVTTEFPSLGLHSAAATGNVGLVEYALNNGQPINSVLDGVLPLHAACAGGNVQVVKVLIDHGADVNAPRLPRKYSNDKNRDSSAPIVGTSGSTPLHFAAANGNGDVVSLLLLHGAHADRPDKHGVTPEMLAQQNGWVECVKVLREWIMNKDRDLREREEFGGKSGSSYAGQITPDPQPSSPRRRLHVKQSIDTALNMLKTADPTSKSLQSVHTLTPPASPLKPFGEYTFYPVDTSNNYPIDTSLRRPSLPLSTSGDTPRNRKPSATLPSHGPRLRRPRSAGNGADRSPEQETTHSVYGRGGSGRKLGSKYSLLNIFKKAHPGEGTDGFPESTLASDIPGGFSGAVVPIPSRTPPSGYSGQISNIDPAESATSAPARLFKLHRGSDASTKSRFTPQSHPQATNIPPIPGKLPGNIQTPPRTNVPLAVELHLALAHQQQNHRNPSNPPTQNEVPGDDGDRFKPSSPLAKFNAMINPSQNRNRSASSSSMPVGKSAVQDDETASGSIVNPENESGRPSPNTRPGILRAHNRTSSSGQGGSPVNSPRTLRFDSSSSNPTNERKAKDSPRSIPAPLRSYSSTGSLTKLNTQTNTDTSPISGSGIQTAPADDSIIDDGDGDHEENYGQPIITGSSIGNPNLLSVLLQRQRGLSFASSSESSLSPILSNENMNDPSLSVLNAEFPFSINRSPSLNEEHADIPNASPDNLNVPVATDNRNRGDSLSSESTSDSRGNMPMSSSNTSGSGASVTVASPNFSNSLLPHPNSRAIMTTERPTESGKNKQVPPPLPINVTVGLNGRRAHTPSDIDISAISSHAQAAALVQRARQEVLEVANAQEGSPLASSIGRTPLSARLAAYGESLALERKLREQKEEETYLKDPIQDPEPIPSSPSATMTVLPDMPTLPQQKSREGMERQLSLEKKTDLLRYKKQSKDPRRPSTADGPSSARQDFFAQRSPSHQASRSASTSNYSSGLFQDEMDDQSPSFPIIDHTPISQVDIRETSLQGASRPVNPIIQSPKSLSRINSGDGVDTETDSTPTLSMSSPRGKREQVRTAKKLTRMGIAVADQAAAASRITPTTPTPSTPKRFGLRSIMQTFKGKA